MENKERLTGVEAQSEQIDARIVDLSEEKLLPREVQHWMEEVERKPQAVVHDDKGQPVLTPTPAAVPTIKIKTNRTAFVTGFKRKVEDVGLWLSTFVFRLMKRNKDKLVEFENE
jgi:hypothetical protein